MPQKADPRISQLAHHPGSCHPILDLAPAALKVAGGRARSREEQAGDHVELDPAARKGIRDLGHTTGAAIGQPGRRVRVGVLHGRDWLQVEHQHRRTPPLHRRQHLRGGRIGADVTDDQIHVVGSKLVARRLRGRSRIDQPRRHNLRPHFCQPSFHLLLVANQQIPQPLKLRPIGRQPDPKNPYTSALRTHRYLLHSFFFLWLANLSTQCPSIDLGQTNRTRQQAAAHLLL